MEIITFLVNLAQQITGQVGEYEASGILKVVSDFLSNFDIAELVTRIIAIAK